MAESSTRRPLVGALLALAGLGLLTAGVGGVGGPPVWLRGVIIGVGAAVLFLGFDAAVERLLGRPVDTGSLLAGVWLGVVVFGAVGADLLPLAETRDPSRTLGEQPRLRPDLWSSHPLGTDSQALDMLGGVLYGARVSLQVSLLAVAVGMTVGGLLGMMAGYFRGRFDQLVGTLTDSVLAFPPLVLLLAVVALLRPNVVTIGLALAFVTVPIYIRLARATTLSVAEREFVAAARVLGATTRRILFRELLPNVARPLLTYSFIVVAVLIVAEASLSYLGVGIQRPTPTWGNMIAAGQNEFQQTPHLVFVPGAVMLLTVFSLNRLGDKARVHDDPREAQL